MTALDERPLTWVEAWPRGHGELRAREFFAARFGMEADGAWSAPGRVTIIGEHTDYGGGLSLPTATAHRTYVAAKARHDDVVRIASANSESLAGPDDLWTGTLESITPESAAGWPGYVAGVLWALQERGFDGPGLDIAVVSCLPIGVGLGSSAALTAATALAANDLWRLALDGTAGHAELAETCVDAECEIVGTPTAGLDQHTALRCREGEAVELDFSTRPPQATHRPLYFPDYGLGMLVIDTRIPHHEAGGGGWFSRRAECEEAARQLGVESLREIAERPDPLKEIQALKDPLLRQRARHVVSEIARVKRVVVELGDTGPAHERFVEIGKEIFRGHASLEVDFGLSGPELNLAVDAAFRAGALGARMLAGGFAGSAMALVRRAEADSIAASVRDEFENAGFREPQFLMI